MLEIAFYTDRGPLEQNEDCLYLDGLVTSGGKGNYTREGFCLLAVCDGVAGSPGGAMASRLAAEAMDSLEKAGPGAEAIEQTLELANRRILEEQRRDPDHREMATTIVGLCLRDREYHVFNIGDSRAYRYRKPYLSQLSVDHTLVREMELYGKASAEALHVITRCLGSERSRPEIGSGRLRGAEDVLLLCSDGVTDAVDDNTLEAIIGGGGSAEALCHAIQQAAIENKTQDNLSIIVVKEI